MVMAFLRRNQQISKSFASFLKYLVTDISRPSTMAETSSDCFTPDNDASSSGGGCHSSSQAHDDAPPKTPLLSILNVVVDHVMLPPSPMEPMEFREVCRWRQQQQQQQKQGKEVHCKENGTCNGNEQGSNSTNLFSVVDGTTTQLSSSALHRDHDDQFNQPSIAAAANDDRDDDGEPALPHGLSSANIDIRVPILRVFGPILRDGNVDEYINNSQASSTSSNTQDIHGSTQSSAGGESTTSTTASTQPKKTRIQQPQSGCLHIHGAYPYMLARPIIAGPDGSMNMHHGFDNSDGRVNWDDANSVSIILEEVHCRLELALRASYEHHDTIGSNNKAEVVIPGAAVGTTSSNSGTGGTNGEKKDDATAANAPTEKAKSNKSKPTPLFIRQVTIVSGRGFYTYCSGPPAPFLRVEYYDPRMRWRVKMVLERGLELNDLYHPDPEQYDYADILSAHEGYNDGSGDGDVRPLKFRCYEAHIPYTMQMFKDCNLAGLKYIKVGEARFRNPLPRSLRKRTKEEFSEASNANQMNDSAFFLAHTVPDEWMWPKLETSDVDGGTTKLNEYWTKKQTCCDVEFDSTVQQLLNVLDVMTELPSPLEERQKIHWRAVPSLREIWEQERKRMSLLLPPENDFLSCKEEVEDEMGDYDDDEDSSDSDEADDEKVTATPQFTLNVKKGVSRPGSKLAVKGVKQLFKTSAGLEDDFRRALKDILSRHESSIDDVDTSLKDKGGGFSTVNGNTGSTFQTPRGLSQIDEECQLNNCGDILTPSLHDGIEALAALGDQFTQNSEGDNENASPSSGLLRSDSLTPIARKLDSLKNYDSVSLSQKDMDDEIEMLTFGDQVDTEETVQSKHQHNDDSFDQSEHFDLEESDEEDDHFLAEEERMGESGFEKALTQLATQAESNEDSNVDVGADTEDPHFHFEATHHPVVQFSEDAHDDLLSDDNSSHVQPNKRNSPEIVATTDDNEGLRLSNLSQPSNDSAPSDGVGQFVVEEYITSPDSGKAETGFSQKHTPELPAGAFIVEPQKSISLRCGEVSNLTQQSESTTRPWHAIPSTPLDTCPPWFLFQSKNSATIAPFVISKACYLEPVKRPPSYAQVKSWMKVNRKRSTPTTTQSTKLDKKSKSGSTKSPSNGNSEIRSSQEGTSYLTAFTQYSQLEGAQEETPDPLAGLGQQGCLVQVSAGGGLKTQINTSTTFTPLTIMSIEVHVQTRTNVGTKDRKDVAMVPDSSRDAVFAAVYIYGRDPGGGESLEILQRGCVLVTIEAKGRAASSGISTNRSKATIGISSDITVERVKSERSLLLRIASIVQLKDPDCIISWDTLGSGIGYLVERGAVIGTTIDGTGNKTSQIDMARLLGRTPRATSSDSTADNSKAESFLGADDDQRQDNAQTWSGSGLGAEWDDRVGAGVAAASIVS